MEEHQAVHTLRMSILELAVSGRLVTSDPSDSYLSKLASNNSLRKEALAREGKIGKVKKPKPIGDEIQASYPASWLNGQLGTLFLVVMGNSPPGTSYNDKGDGVPLINGPVEFSPEALGKTLTTKFTTEPTRMCEEDDMLVCVRGATTGRTNIASNPACIGRGVALVRGWESQSFLNLVLWTLGARLLSMGKGTTFPSISYDDLAGLEIAIPPLSEQEKIINRVQHLMLLCDQLEERLQNREQLAERLAESAAHRLTA